MATLWERFKQAARLEESDSVPVAFIVDSPWLPGYAWIDALDFFLYADKRYEIRRARSLVRDLGCNLTAPDLE